ncbi:MAG: PorT family protein [Bacteroidetes bacterium]|nr:PorT family protein [Bacteroidota bacterium]
MTIKIPLSVKKAALFCIVLLCIQYAATGKPQHKFTIGVAGGPSLISLRGSAALSQLKRNEGWQAGATMQYAFSKHWSVRTGLSYERKGAKEPDVIVILDSMGTSSGQVTPRLRYDYLTLPLQLQYSIGKKVKYYVAAGIYSAYLVSRQDIIKGANIKPMVMFDSRAYDYNFDCGLSFSAGITLPVYKRFLASLELRDNIGMFNTVKLPTIVGVDNVKTRAAAIVLGVQYKL